MKIVFIFWCLAESADRVSNFLFVVLSGVACYVDRERRQSSNRTALAQFMRVRERIYNILMGRWQSVALYEDDDVDSCTVNPL